MGQACLPAALQRLYFAGCKESMSAWLDKIYFKEKRESSFGHEPDQFSTHNADTKHYMQDNIVTKPELQYRNDCREQKQ